MKTAVEKLFELIDEIPFNSPEASDFYQEVMKLKDQAKLIEQEQLRTMHLITWMNKDVDFDNYYFETYEDQRSNIND